MTYHVDEWDAVEKVQKRRDATPEEAADIDARKADKSEFRGALLHQINIECDRIIGSLVAVYPRFEIDTFPRQDIEARAFLIDPDSATPLLDALSDNRGIDKAELAGKIIENSDAYSAYAGAVIGYRQKLEIAVNASSDSDLSSIDIASGWPA